MSEKSIPFEKSFASHTKSKFWSEKNDVKPKDIPKNASKRYLFDCNKCGHEFGQTIYEIVNRNGWCSFCASRKSCTVGDCVYCLNKSFESHPKKVYWSKKNKLLPRQVFLNTNKIYIFDCNECKHEFNCSPNAINIKNCWCGFCASQNLCDDNNCQFCYNKSFASSDKAKFWSESNSLKPRGIFLNNVSKFYFNCDKCKHEFDASPNNITSSKTWCPYCSHNKLCNDQKCQFCYNNSFASALKSQFWSKKNKETPRDIFKGSNIAKYLFNCNKCHKEFSMTPNHITTDKSWCPFCFNKTEKKLYAVLLEIYEDVEWQFMVEWCKHKTFLPFDFAIHTHKVIIELDGRQHFEQVSNWVSPEKTRDTDKHKMRCAVNNGFSVIRIMQEDVLYDRYDWLAELQKQIIEASNKATIIYMCKNNEYDVYDDN